MRFIVLGVLYISVIIIKHLQWKNLITDDAGNIISYVNLVFFYPLGTACLVAAAFCVIFRKTAQPQIIAGTSWVMGIILLFSCATHFWQFFSWEYTAPNAPITLTFPSNEWKTAVTTPRGYRMTVVMKNAHVAISVMSSMQDASNVHNFDELLTSQQIHFKSSYQADAFTLYPCQVDGFRCAYQDYIATTDDGDEKRSILMTLLDNTHFIQVAAVIDQKYADEYYEEVMTIFNSAKPIPE